MTEQLELIAQRIRSMRELLDLTCAQVATAAGLTEEEYLKYENAEVDFSFSVMHNIAKVFGMDVTDLITGESPKLSRYIITRAGHGHSIQRNNAYDYKHLALNFKNKMIEPFLVTLTPDDKEKVANSHQGQEFDYVLEGALKIVIAGEPVFLEPGDSMFYDSSNPHAMYAVGEQPAKFLAIVTE